MDDEPVFIKDFQKCRRGVLSPVLYCNNVAIIGEKIIDNREQTINRGHEQQTRIKWTKHWRERSISRGVSALDTIATMQHGIRFRSDVKSGRRWVKRAVYLWHHFVVVSLVHPKHLVTCYKIEPISRSAFDWCVSLTEEERKAIRKTLKTVKPPYSNYSIYELIGDTSSETNYNSLHGL